MSLTSESNEKMMTMYAKDSPDSDDADSRRNVGGNGCLKKGPWTAAEDAILADYVTRHGEGNWNAVQKHTGLARCGKSCRLRWANHLRPDLKKGAFSPEEENLIIKLHAKLGNKWARMAAELPGRTDNEIKNYWNTRIKRQQRAGLPIYPPEICLQALKENQQKDDTCTFSSGDMRYTDFVPLNNIEFQSVEFKTLELNHPVYSPPYLEIPASSLSGQGLHSSCPNKPLHSILHPSKRLRGSDTLSTDLRQYHNISYVQNGQSFMYSPSPTYDHNLTSNEASSSSIIDGNQYQNAVLNGNPSSSKPVWATKVELPSDQTQVDNWGSPSSPLPPLKSVDTLIQTPLLCHLSRQNSGLLDDVLHESQTMRSGSHHVMDDHDTSSQVIRETAWDLYGELTSPLGHSSSFSEGTTPISGDSFDEPEPVDPGFRAKQDATIWNPMQYESKVEMTNQMFSRPVLLKDHNKNNGNVHDWKAMFTT